MKGFCQGEYAKPMMVFLLSFCLFGFFEIMGRTVFKVSLIDALSGKVFTSSTFQYNDRLFVVHGWYSTGIDYCVALDVYYDNGHSKTALVTADHTKLASVDWRVVGGDLAASLNAEKSSFRLQLSETDFNDFREETLPWRNGTYEQLK